MTGGQISPGTAALGPALPTATTQAAQNTAFGNIGGLQSFNQPRQGVANALTNQQVWNPFSNQMAAGAQQAAQFGTQAATNAFNLGGNQIGVGQGVQSQANQLLPWSQQVMQTAMDP